MIPDKVLGIRCGIKLCRILEYILWLQTGRRKVVVVPQILVVLQQPSSNVQQRLALEPVRQSANPRSVLLAYSPKTQRKKERERERGYLVKFS
jgi:hypothetical protein